MKVGNDELFLFDSYVGNLHFILTTKSNKYILKIGRYDQEYKSKKIGEFKFDKRKFFEVCDMFYSMSVIVRKHADSTQHYDGLNLKGFNVEHKKVGNKEFLRFKGDKGLLSKLLGL